MNRFQKFLDKSGISAGHLHSLEERASFFVWYHLRATGDTDVDLGIIEWYLKESGTNYPGLNELYPLMLKGRTATEGATPGRFKLPTNDSFDIDFKAAVFDAKRLAPFYFERGPDGMVIKIGSTWDKVKYWPQRHWAAFWLMALLAVWGGWQAIWGAMANV